MNPVLAASLAVPLLVACGGGGVEGHLVDAMHGDTPLAGETLVAKATSKVRMTCQQLSAVTDAEGRFAFDGLCLSETAYEITPSNDNLFLAEVAPIAGPGEGLVLRGWWAPKGDGTYLLQGGELTPLKTHADIRRVQIPDSLDSVAYPTTLPEQVPALLAGDHLVLTGQVTLEKTVIAPLVHSEARTFGETTLEPWWYIGVRFESDTELEPVAATPAPDRVTEVQQGARIGRFIAAEALPAGRYVVFREGGRRASILQFGEASEAVTEGE